MNVDRLGRSILLIYNKNRILDRVTLVVSLNDSLPVVNEDRLGRSVH